MPTRYEILPFSSVEAEAAAAPRPTVITVTCSPRHGVDHTVEFAGRLARLGHHPVAHLAARTIRNAAHLDDVLARLRSSRVHDVFVIGGDGAAPLGPFASSLELLPLIAAHELRPRSIGVGAYPEGHPLIDAVTLGRALRQKAELADYMTTQLCFAPRGLLQWLEETRQAGVELPAYIGIPGIVDRRRLLEVSMRIGVGTSISFLRKQRGMRQLLGRQQHASGHLHDAVAPLVGDAQLGIVGVHFYTFNRLSATLAWETNRRDHGVRVG